MIDNNYEKKCEHYLTTLCVEIPERCVGSKGNRAATSFFEKEISSFGWKTSKQEFDAIDWKDGGVILKVEDKYFAAFVSPYSLGCEVKSELIPISSINELEKSELYGKIVLLHGDIAKEQIMPKNFVFYNPEHHKTIISLLEKSGVKAIIAATGMNSSTAGGVYPFPLIEDGDFNIPSVYMKDIDGEKLIEFAGKQVYLKSVSNRIPGKGYNIIAQKGTVGSERIIVSAHIDAKKGTPGAIDNATGVAVLLLLAELMNDYNGNNLIEIVAFNGEDYYAVPGQMLYLESNKDMFDNIILNVNIDGAGYKEGMSAFSFFNLPETMKDKAQNVIQKYQGIIEGKQWVQGDHSMFVQACKPAIAVSSNWFIQNMESQNVTHTLKDNLDIVDLKKVTEIAFALKDFLESL